MGVSPAQAEGGGVSIRQPPGAAVPHIRSALTQLEDLDGWYPLAAVGARLAVLLPEFDPRTYACAKLVTLIERSEAFDVKRENLRVLIRPHRPHPPVSPCEHDWSGRDGSGRPLGAEAREFLSGSRKEAR